MKLDKLNLGKALSKDEQKEIRGGDNNVCTLSVQVAYCVCTDGFHFCYASDGVHSSSQLCAASGVCPNHGGTASSACVDTCPPCGDEC